jgi:hypothetical protein
MTYKIYICGPGDCPNDPDFIHEMWPFGCVPKNFSMKTGRSRTHRQTLQDVPGYGKRYRWNGGCDAAGVIPHDWGPPGDSIVVNDPIVLEIK